MRQLVNSCRAYFETGNVTLLRRGVVGYRGEMADAMREMIQGGRHEGACRFDLPDGACSIHVATARERRARLLQLTEQELGMKSKVVQC